MLGLFLERRRGWAMGTHWIVLSAPCTAAYAFLFLRPCFPLCHPPPCTLPCWHWRRPCLQSARVQVQRHDYGPPLCPRRHPGARQLLRLARHQRAHRLQPPLPGGGVLPSKGRGAASRHGAECRGSGRKRQSRGDDSHLDGSIISPSFPPARLHDLASRRAPPPQIMADIMTVKEHVGRYEDVKVQRGRGEGEG